MQVQDALRKFVGEGSRGLIIAGPDVMPSKFYGPSSSSGGSGSSSGTGRGLIAAREALHGHGRSLSQVDVTPAFPDSSVPVNLVSGPMGIVFTGYVSDPGGTLTVGSAAAGSSELANSELAAQQYLAYLRGQAVLSPTELAFGEAGGDRSAHAVLQAGRGEATTAWVCVRQAATTESGRLGAGPIISWSHRLALPLAGRVWQLYAQCVCVCAWRVCMRAMHHGALPHARLPACMRNAGDGHRRGSCQCHPGLQWPIAALPIGVPLCPLTMHPSCSLAQR